MNAVSAQSLSHCWIMNTDVSWGEWGLQVFRCCSGVFYELLDESVLCSWSNFDRPVTPGKVHTAPSFLYLWIMSLTKSAFCIYLHYLCVILSFVWWSESFKCEKYANNLKNRTFSRHWHYIYIYILHKENELSVAPLRVWYLSFNVSLLCFVKSVFEKYNITII